MESDMECIGTVTQAVTGHHDADQLHAQTTSDGTAEPEFAYFSANMDALTTSEVVWTQDTLHNEPAPLRIVVTQPNRREAAKARGSGDSGRMLKSTSLGRSPMMRLATHNESTGAVVVSDRSVHMVDVTERTPVRGPTSNGGSEPAPPGRNFVGVVCTNDSILKRWITKERIVLLSYVCIFIVASFCLLRTEGGEGHAQRRDLGIIMSVTLASVGFSVVIAHPSVLCLVKGPDHCMSVAVCVAACVELACAQLLVGFQATLAVSPFDSQGMAQKHPILAIARLCALGPILTGVLQFAAAPRRVLIVHNALVGVLYAISASADLLPSRLVNHFFQSMMIISMLADGLLLVKFVNGRGMSQLGSILPLLTCHCICTALYVVLDVCTGYTLISAMQSEIAMFIYDLLVVLLASASISVLRDDTLPDYAMKIRCDSKLATSSYAEQRKLFRYLFHEMRVPLHSIMMAAEELGYSGAGGDGYLTKIIRSGGRKIHKVLEDCSFYVDAAQTQVALHLGACRVERMIRVAMNMSYQDIANRNLRCHVFLDRSLPTVIHTDAIRVHQMLLSLLSNAIRFSPVGNVINIYAICACKTTDEDEQTVVRRLSDCICTGASPVARSSQQETRSFELNEISTRTLHASDENTKAFNVDNLAESHSSTGPRVLATPLVTYSTVNMQSRSLDSGAPASYVKREAAAPMDVATLRFFGTRRHGHPPHTFGFEPHSAHLHGRLGDQLSSGTPAGTESHPPPASSVVFVVEDSGPGIHPSELDKLFAPFEQLQSCAAQKANSTGMGLSICSLLARALGGRIGCVLRNHDTGNPTDGDCTTGCKFWFSIPLQQPS